MLTNIVLILAAVSLIAYSFAPRIVRGYTRWRRYNEICRIRKEWRLNKARTYITMVDMIAGEQITAGQAVSVDNIGSLHVYGQQAFSSTQLGDMQHQALRKRGLR